MLHEKGVTLCYGKMSYPEEKLKNFKSRVSHFSSSWCIGRIALISDASIRIGLMYYVFRLVANRTGISGQLRLFWKIISIVKLRNIRMIAWVGDNSSNRTGPYTKPMEDGITMGHTKCSQGDNLASLMIQNPGKTVSQLCILNAVKETISLLLFYHLDCEFATRPYV